MVLFPITLGIAAVTVAIFNPLLLYAVRSMLSRSLLYEAIEATSVVIGLRRGYKSVPAIITANTGMCNPSHTVEFFDEAISSAGMCFPHAKQIWLRLGIFRRNLDRTLGLLLNLLAVASFDFP